MENDDNDVPSSKYKALLARLIQEKEDLIKEKESDLECPVCLETADIPIYCCIRQHLICSSCRTDIKECPVCRVIYRRNPVRHRYAEKTVEELKRS